MSESMTGKTGKPIPVGYILFDSGIGILFPDETVQDIVGELRHCQKSDDYGEGERGQPVGPGSQERAVQPGMFFPYQFVPEEFLGVRECEKYGRHREKPFPDEDFHPFPGGISVRCHFVFGAEKDDAVVVKPVEQHVSEPENQQGIVPDDAVEPDERGPEDIEVFQRVDPFFQEDVSEQLVANVYGHDDPEHVPKSRKQLRGKLREFVFDEPAEVHRGLPGPPIEQGKSRDAPDDGFVEPPGNAGFRLGMGLVPRAVQEREPDLLPDEMPNGDPGGQYEERADRRIEPNERRSNEYRGNRGKNIEPFPL